MSAFTCDYAGAAPAPSPNFGERAGGRTPDIILLHYTGMETAEGALKWLRAPESQVSCHYFVHEDGRIEQLVREADRAWHAGKSFWKGEVDINSASIGIEIVNAGHPGGLPDFPEKQIDAVVELCLDCGRRWDIAPERVLAHSDVAPIRKVDPGENFPWQRLHAGGVGHWVEPSPIAGGRFFQKGMQASPSRPCRPCCRSMAMPLKSMGFTRKRPRAPWRLSSGISGPYGSTELPISRPSIRSTGCSPRCRVWAPEAIFPSPNITECNGSLPFRHILTRLGMFFPLAFVAAQHAVRA